jgi:hypothetical protein
VNCHCLASPKVAACSETGSSCGSLFDYTVSSVWLPESVANGAYGNPTDDEVKESICYTKDVDLWFIATTAANEASGFYGERLPQVWVPCPMFFSACPSHVWSTTVAVRGRPA